MPTLSNKIPYWYRSLGNHMLSWHQKNSREKADLKCPRGIVHTVDSQIVIQRVAGHAAKNRHLELLHGTVCNWFSGEGICPKAVQEHMAGKGVQKAITGCRFIFHWHHFLLGKGVLTLSLERRCDLTMTLHGHIQSFSEYFYCPIFLDVKCSFSLKIHCNCLYWELKELY